MSKDLPPSRTADQFVLRFPSGMRDQIAEAAKANNRSMNSELIARLQQSFEPHADTDEVGWDLLVAQRVLQLRIGSLDDALRLYRMMKDALLARIDELRHADPANNLPPAIRLASEIDGVIVDLVERVSVARSEYSVVAAKINVAERRRTQRIDEAIAVGQVEDEIRELEQQMSRIEQSWSDVGVTQAQADAAEAAERERRLHFVRRMSGSDPFLGIEPGQPRTTVESINGATAPKKSPRM